MLDVGFPERIYPICNERSADIIHKDIPILASGASLLNGIGRDTHRFGETITHLTLLQCPSPSK